MQIIGYFLIVFFFLTLFSFPFICFLLIQAYCLFCLDQDECSC